MIPDLKPRALAWFIIEPLLPSRVLAEARRKCAEVTAAAHARGYRRIEAHVHERFPRGCRFAGRLGFVLEGYSPCWLPDDGTGHHAGVFNFAASTRRCRRGCWNEVAEKSFPSGYRYHDRAGPEPEGQCTFLRLLRSADGWGRPVAIRARSK